MPITQTILSVKCTIEHLNTKRDNVSVAYKLGATVKDLAQSTKADVAINFNFADNNTGTPIGLLTVNSNVVNKDIPKTIPRDSFCIQADGSFLIGKPNADTNHSVQGSPRLLRGGFSVVDETIKRDQTGPDIWSNNAKRLRVAVGIISSTQAVIVRTHSAITLHKLADIMSYLDCSDALNGDGGGSAYLYPVDNGWGRKMGSALVVEKGEDNVGNKPLLIIDAGHGGSDPGASGNGIIEKNMVLDISLYQYERFKQLGVNVVLTRNNDTFIDSTPRANIVKNSGAKYCISNHINAASSTTAKGAEIIHSIHNDGKLAKAFADVLKAAGQVLRPTATFSKSNANKQDYYYMHRQTGSVTTNIIEYGFLSNAEDAARLKSNWQKYAEAVVKAFCEFVGHKYTPITTQQVPVNNEATIVVNGKELSVKGEIKDGVTRVPVRAIAEALGMKVGYDATTKTVTLDK